ncbi:MAG: ribbon-helix-helix protein, CopG family [Salinisphaera sp.]|nr:ribbon-helix-helix protein, CopG family [Salinisphaera sp.]
MPGTRHFESVTFRLDPALKAALAKLASRDSKSLGALLRDMARERLSAERHRTFEAEAERQSRAAAEAARQPGTEEYAVMRELEHALDESDEAWK